MGKELRLKGKVESAIDRILLKEEKIGDYIVAILLWLNNMEIWVYISTEDGEIDLPITVTSVSEALAIHKTIVALIRHIKGE